MAAKARKAVEIFYSYAHEDELLRNALEKQLSTLARQGLISGGMTARLAGAASGTVKLLSISMPLHHSPADQPRLHRLRLLLWH
jgi:uncharacterized membrane protein YcjF (UPF0283 family)